MDRIDIVTNIEAEIIAISLMFKLAQNRTKVLKKAAISPIETPN
jgi:hypothetical protein